ncbi:MAG: NAD-dependent DNA ligase LigA [Actinomycetia bacterium]|nr:NAD-dependent DNA ligase LigA [Actinomycetes bacterium]
MNSDAFSLRSDYTAAVARTAEAAGAYYDGDAVLMDDHDYDTLLRRIEATEAVNPDWVEGMSVIDQVAAGGASGGDVTHVEPMLSLDNAMYGTGELDAWFDRSADLVGRVDGYAVEPKLDGLAASLTYVDGRLVLIATRGDGRTGEDVTGRARHAAGIPSTLSEPLSLEVRGELVMTDEDFEAANNLRLAHGDTPFVNPRNGTAGAVRALHKAYKTPLSFGAYSAHRCEMSDGSHVDAMGRLADLGFTTARTLCGRSQQVFATPEEAAAEVAAIGEARAGMGVGIDGAVIKFDAGSNRNAAGSTSKAPRWAIAYKYAADTRLTRLNAITIQVGRTAKLTPVAELEPVFVGGAMVSRATLSNPGQVAAKGLRVGDMVWVRRAGDVIPEITGFSAEHRSEDSVDWESPVECPRCSSAIDKSSLNWRCAARCTGVEQLVYFCSRKAMDIEGLSQERLAVLLEAGLVTDAADLYSLDPAALAELPRMGAKSAANLVAEINASRSQPLDRLLTALGIDALGTSLSRRIAKQFQDLASVQAAGVDAIAGVDGLGPVRAKAVVDGLAGHADLLARLVAVGLRTDAEAVAVVEVADNPIAGKKVCVSGSVPGLTRDQAKVAVESLGGTSVGSVSKNTGLLVAGDGAGSKLAKAESLGVEVMDAADFAALLAAAA